MVGPIIYWRSYQRSFRRWAIVVGVVLSLAGAGVGAEFARASDDPPEFAGIMGQFTLLNPTKKAPFREILDKNGMPVDLKRFRGKVILLNFWATWCAPCRIEMPSLDRLQAAMGGKRFMVVALSVDRFGAARVLPFLKENKLANLEVFLDPRSRNYRAFGVPGLPMSFLIDPTGQVIGYLKGHAEWDTGAARKLIRYYLARAAGH